MNGNNVAEFQPLTFTAQPSWAALKASLAQQNPNLQPFVAPMEHAITDAAKGLLPRQIADYRYSRFMIEPLINDVAVLLDRCAGYRRQAAELEISAVKAAEDYRLQTQLYAIDQPLLASSNPQDDFKDLSAEVKKAAEKAESDQSLGAALSEWLEAMSKFYGIVASRNAEILRLQLGRISAQQASSEEFHRRHTERGNSHNYGERYQRVIRLLAQDLAEAYEKAQCAYAGIVLVYPQPVINLVTTLPDISSLDEDKKLTFLDDLIFWTRDTMRLLESRSQFEVESSLIIPLVQKSPWGEVSDTGGLITTAAFTQVMSIAGSGELSFELAIGKYPVEGSPLRLRSLGLSVNFGDDRSFDVVKVAAKVTLPAQKLPSDGVTYQPKQIYIGGVGTLGSSNQPEMVSGLAVYNFSPFGRWTIQLGRFLTGRLTQIDRSSVKDLCLHLRVLSEPKV